jgi:hypothetical protein
MLKVVAFVTHLPDAKPLAYPLWVDPFSLLLRDDWWCLPSM